MKLRKVLAENLREIRYLRGYTLDELDIRSNLSRTFIGDVERQTKGISVDSLERLAKALRVPAWLLLQEQGYKKVLP